MRPINDLFAASKIGRIEFCFFWKQKVQLKNKWSYINCRAFHATSYSTFCFENKRVPDDETKTQKNRPFIMGHPLFRVVTGPIFLNWSGPADPNFRPIRSGQLKNYFRLVKTGRPGQIRTAVNNRFRTFFVRLVGTVLRPYLTVL